MSVASRHPAEIPGSARATTSPSPRACSTNPSAPSRGPVRKANDPFYEYGLNYDRMDGQLADQSAHNYGLRRLHWSPEETKVSQDWLDLIRSSSWKIAARLSEPRPLRQISLTDRL